MNELRKDDGSRKYVTLGEYQEKRRCELCNGTGRDFAKSAFHRCPRCKGTGWVK